MDSKSLHITHRIFVLDISAMLYEFESHLLSTLEKMYMLEAVPRRAKDVENQFSKNQCGPERQRMVYGFLQFVSTAMGS